MLQSGRDYEELPKSFVVFICDFDPVGKELYRYTFKMKCEEDVNVRSKCKADHFSEYAREKSENTERTGDIWNIWKADLEESQKDFHNSYVRRLQDSVQRVKANREMEERFMLWKKN